MDISKLEIKQVVKNYKEMCGILGEKVGDGNTKKYQMREWERYFSFQKEGQKFIINQVFHEPKPKTDLRKGGNNTIYEDLLDKMIINLLIKHKTIEASSSELYSDYFELFTNTYSDLFNLGYTKFAKKHEMGVGLVMTYSQKIKKIVDKCLDTSLSRLEKDGVLTWSKEVYIKSNQEDYFASDELKQLISEKEKIVIEETGINHFQRINAKVNKEFKRHVVEVLLSDDSGILETDIFNYWKIYKIDLVDKNIQRQDEDSNEFKRRLIKQVCIATRNKPHESDGKKYCAFKAEKYDDSINKLNRLIWALPMEKNLLQQVYEEEEFNDNVPF